jgi:hypothetical protein
VEGNGQQAEGNARAGKRFSAISKYLALQCIATGYQRTELRDVINET